jgi:hypothetical protein
LTFKNSGFITESRSAKHGWIRGGIKEIRMRKKLKKEMYRKLLPYVAQSISDMCDKEGYLVTELADRIGLPVNRLSEIRNYENYNDPLNESYLVKLVAGGVLSMKSLLQNVDLSEEERNELDRLSVFDLVAKARELGINVEEALERMIREVEE